MSNEYSTYNDPCPNCQAENSMEKVTVANHLEFDLPYKEYRTEFVCSECGQTVGSGGGYN